MAPEQQRKVAQLLKAVNAAVRAWSDDKAVESGDFGKTMERLGEVRQELFGDLPAPKRKPKPRRVYTSRPFGWSYSGKVWGQTERWQVLDVTEGLEKAKQVFKGTQEQCYKREAELRRGKHV